MRNLIGVLFLIGAVLSGLAIAAQDSATWEVPEEARAVENPVDATPDAVAAGGELYKKHCLMCHGETGKGDGPATQFIKPAPADISTAEAKERMTDGEIFYKITNGKRPMPAMQRKMDDTERWNVVHFVRSLQGN